MQVPVALIDANDAPPLPRLTSRQLRELSAQWRRLAQQEVRDSQDALRAERVALALDWVAEQRARTEPPSGVLAVAQRALAQWRGAWKGGRTAARATRSY